MYLRTPKRYTPKGSKRPLISLRWLWLYLLAPVVIIAATLAWDNRENLSQQIAIAANRIPLPHPFAPTATATLPPTDLVTRISQTLENGSINDALDAMRAYSDSVPNETKWHSTLAQTLILRAHDDPNLIEQAKQAGMAAINANPEAVEGWVSYALVLDWAGQSQTALSYALHAKDMGDTTGMSSAVLAGIYFTLGDVKQASALADEAIKANPNLAYAHFVKGQIAYQGLGNAKDGVAAYREAWDITKADHTQWGGYIAIQLAPFYVQNKQSDQAVSLLADAIKRDKDYAPLDYQLAFTYYGDGKYDKESPEAVQRCIDVDQNFAPCHVLLMRLQFRDGKWESAAQSAQRAIDLGSKETAPYYWGGVAYYKMNKCPEAIKLFNAGKAIAQKKNDDSKVKDFAAALADCGIVSEDTISATTEATAAATAKSATVPKATATPKKR